MSVQYLGIGHVGSWHSTSCQNEPGSISGYHIAGGSSCSEQHIPGLHNRLDGYRCPCPVGDVWSEMLTTCLLSVLAASELT